MHAAVRIAITVGVVGGGLAALLGLSGALDSTPPSLELTGSPTQPVSGALRLAVQVDDRSPGVGGWTLSIDGKPVVAEPLDDGRVSVPLAGLPDGEHTLQLAAWDRAWTPNWAHQSVSFTVDQTPPSLQIARRSLTARQGRVSPVLVTTSEPVDTPRGQLGDRDLLFYPLGDEGRLWRALLGVAIEDEPGERRLQVQVVDRAGNTTTSESTLTVQSSRFSRGGTIRLRPDQVAARRDEEAKAKMREERDTAYAWEQPEQLWAGQFLRPVARGRISSPFGRYRTYSDGKRSHHTGTDIAAPTGTPVVAAAAGEVRFAGEQAIFGNVVIVHHGQGLSTSYNHLSAIDVEPGQRVAQGDRLGAVGTTGQSTGPHLHWGVVVDAVAVDGMPLLKSSLDPEDDEEWAPL